MANPANLPEEYLQWLDQLPELCYVKYKRREWAIARREQLQEVIRLNRDRVPFYAQLTAYVKMWRGLGHDSAQAPKRSRFPYDRLERCVVIGSDNGDPLFVDPGDKYSVWMLRHDSKSGFVEQIAPSLGEWVQKAKPVMEYLGDD
jgi:hypothetical protein